MTLRYKNNVSVTLATSLTDTATTISLTPGDGAQLPVIANGTADTFLITVTDKNGNREIISICRRETGTDTLYVGTTTAHQSAGNIAGRAQESTTALSVTYTDDHSIEMCPTAEPFEAAVQYSDAGELTASTAEINSVCDGCTATAAEITSVCDGNTATAAELSVVHSSGVTNADLVKLHAVTSSAATLNAVVTTARTITAGTGLTGGGTLAANRTIAHAAHTGDVTGTTALTIANGVVGAENMQTGTDERDWVLARCAAASVGVVGTYALMFYDDASRIAGDTVSGSNLDWAGLTGQSAGVGTIVYDTYTSVSGTWRCMGYVAAGGSNGSVSLFLRIS